MAALFIIESVIKDRFLCDSLDRKGLAGKRGVIMHLKGGVYGWT